MVFAFGGAIKFGYFYLSRSMIVEGVTNTHEEATQHLKESRKFAVWASEDRKKRAPELTDQQRQQLQNYLALMATTNKEVYPSKQN